MNERLLNGQPTEFLTAGETFFCSPARLVRDIKDTIDVLDMYDLLDKPPSSLNHPPTFHNPEDYAEFAIRTAAASAINTVREKEHRGYLNMHWNSTGAEQKKSPARVLNQVETDYVVTEEASAVGAREYGNYLLATAANTVLRPLQVDLEQPGCKIGMRKLPDGTLLFSFGTEVMIKEVFDSIAESVDRASMVTDRVFGKPASPNSDTWFVAWCAPSSKVIIPTTETKGYYNSKLGLAVVYSDIAESNKKRSYRENKKINVHELIHAQRATRIHPHLGYFAEEGIVQVLTMLATNGNLLNTHIAVSEAAASLRRVDKVIGEQNGVVYDSTFDTKNQVRFSTLENYRVSCSLFATVFFLDTSSDKFKKFGAFIKTLTDTKGLIDSAYKVYGITRDTLEQKWKENIRKARSIHPTHYHMEPASYEIIPFGGKELIAATSF